MYLYNADPSISSLTPRLPINNPPRETAAAIRFYATRSMRFGTPQAQAKEIRRKSEIRTMALLVDQSVRFLVARTKTYEAQDNTRRIPQSKTPLNTSDKHITGILRRSNTMPNTRRRQSLTIRFAHRLQSLMPRRKETFITMRNHTLNTSARINARNTDCENHTR